MQASSSDGSSYQDLIMLLPAQNHGSLIRTSFRKNFKLWIRPTMTTLKSLINKQGGYVVFLVLREYSFIRNFRVYFFKAPFQSFFSWLSNKNLAVQSVQSVQSVQWLGKVPVLVISYSLKSMWLSLTTQYPFFWKVVNMMAKLFACHQRCKLDAVIHCLCPPFSY